MPTFKTKNGLAICANEFAFHEMLKREARRQDFDRSLKSLLENHLGDLDGFENIKVEITFPDNKRFVEINQYNYAALGITFAE